MDIITILLVENDDATRLLLNNFLSMSHYSVLVANDGQEAIDKYINEQVHIDLFITDIMMPEVNGLELLMYIKKQKLYQNIPVIGITGGYADYLKSISQEKFDTILIKPLVTHELLSWISSLLIKSGKKIPTA